MNFWGKRQKADVNTPVTNKTLKQAFQRFYLDTNEITLSTLSFEINVATFLVLIYKDGLSLSTASSPETILFQKGDKIKFLDTFDQNKNRFLPIFTDWSEIDLWLENRENVIGWMMSIKDVIAFVRRGNYKGLVINLCSDKWDMDKNQIDTFLKETSN